MRPSASAGCPGGPSRRGSSSPCTGAWVQLGAGGVGEPAPLIFGWHPFGEPSAAIAERVLAARDRQRERSGADAPASTNAALSARRLKRICRIDDAGRNLLDAAIERLGLSARAYTRVRRVARTIADLAGDESIRPPHLAEAIQYRSLDRRLVILSTGTEAST